jgi:hypothetical protein
MENNGIEEILSKDFGEVAKLFSGKKFPNLLTEEILRGIFLFS